jgi:hypothetical protein
VSCFNPKPIEALQVPTSPSNHFLYFTLVEIRANEDQYLKFFSEALSKKAPGKKVRLAPKLSSLPAGKIEKSIDVISPVLLC